MERMKLVRPHYDDERDDWIGYANTLETRVAELEAALVESNKLTLTPRQQGEIAARALFPLRAARSATEGGGDALSD